MQYTVQYVRGLKGTISEVELDQIKARMVRGRLNRAQRGELTWTLPVGLEYDRPTSQIRLAVEKTRAPRSGVGL